MAESVQAPHRPGDGGEENSQTLEEITLAMLEQLGAAGVCVLMQPHGESVRSSRVASSVP